ncbi:MAG: lytic transglycosylase domain-containing protein [Syntrophothermus sp.]
MELNKNSIAWYRKAGSYLLVVLITIPGVLAADRYLLHNRTGEKFLSAADTISLQITSPAIPAALDFCGEKVPLDKFYVRERIDREMIVNSYFHSATILAFKRANRWFPVIEPILRKNNIPDDFKFLCVIESNLENAVSPANAVGFWQFTEGAAARYGLEVNDIVDERYNVEKSTEAACQYLKYAYSRFGSWTLAAASYNAGLEGVDKQIRRQKMKNYYNLLFGEETMRYVARIVALKTIFAAPGLYGYRIPKEELYPGFETRDIEINYRINDLADFSIKEGISYKILKILNPWLRDNVLPAKGKSYLLKVPKDKSMDPVGE